MNTNANNEINRILSKLQQKDPSLYDKIFGSYSHNSSSNDNAIIGRRKSKFISHCNEALRILKGRSLGKKENQTIRTALVIDYLIRNVRNTDTNMYFQASIPMTELMGVIGLKKNRKNDLVNMQQMLDSYLERTAIATKIARVAEKGSNKQSAKNSRKRNAYGSAASMTSGTSTIDDNITQTGLIRELCIKLGPLIPDAEFVSKYATKLFDTLASNASNKRLRSSKSSDSRIQHLRQDMVRFLECYEGACFFLAVKESEGANYNELLKMKASAEMSLKNQQNRTEMKKKSSDGGRRKEEDPSKYNAGDDDQDDDNEEVDDDTEDDRPMNEMDVVTAACLSERTFSEVLAYVKEFAREIVISVDDGDQKKPAGKKKNGSKKGTGSDQRFVGRSVIVESNYHSDKPMRRSGNNVEFERWKKSVLKSKLDEQTKKYGDTNMPREAAIKRIAEEAFQQMQKKSWFL